MIALVYALEEEARTFPRDTPSVVFWCTGVGMNRAHEGTEHLLTKHSPSLILSIGFAGASDPSLQSGDLVVATEIRSETPGDRFSIDPKSRQRLEDLIRESGIPFVSGPLLTVWKMADRKTKEEWGRKGIKAIDMETAAIAAVAQKREIPLLSLRAIFDPADEELPFTEPVSNSREAAAFFLKNPKTLLQIPKFMRMNRICQKNLSRIVGAFLRPPPTS